MRWRRLDESSLFIGINSIDLWSHPVFPFSVEGLFIQCFRDPSLPFSQTALVVSPPPHPSQPSGISFGFLNLLAYLSTQSTPFYLS